MKKLLLSLVVIATIFSCGKKNSVSSGSSVSGLSSSVSGATEVNLATAINNGSFANVNNPNETYEYYRATQSASSCTVKWSIFTVCSNSSSNSGSTFVRAVISGSVDIVAKKAELISIINKRTSVYTTGTISYIYTTDAKVYTIDTSYPLQANPLKVQDNTAKTLEFLGRIY